MDLERIEALIEVIKDARVTELSVKCSGSSVTLRKSPRTVSAITVAQQAAKARKNGGTKHETVAEPELPAGTVISAPMVGIFHVAEGFTAPGTTVKKGQVIGSIESMKLMNDVKAAEDGKVAEVYVEDGMPVEYGQSLVRLEKL